MTAVQRRLLFRLSPLPFVVAGLMVFDELKKPLGWGTALGWALGAGAAATGIFIAVFFVTEARKQKKQEAQEQEVSRRPRR